MSRRLWYYSVWNHPRTEGSGLESAQRGFYRLRGVVATPQGFVEVVGLTSGYIPGRDAFQKKWGPVTRLALIKNGKKHMRDIPRLLTRLGAVRAAAKFAREVAA